MKIKLGELADIMTGNTPSMKVNEYYDSNDIPFIKPDSFKSHFELEANSFISNKAERKARIVGSNCILVSCIGIIGKVGITSQKVAFNQQINSLNVKPHYDIEYIAYNLLFNKDRLQRICNSAVVPIINKTQFSDFEISINKDIIIQRVIKRKLNLLSSIINNNKKKLLLLDDIVKSRFVEMFGDPVINNKKWASMNLHEISIKITSGNTPQGGSRVYINHGVLFIRSQNVWNNRLDLDDVVHISESLNEKMKETRLRKNDLLITKTGRFNTENSSLGRCALYTGPDFQANINGHVYLVRLKAEYNPNFILSILTSEAYKNLIRTVCVGGIDKRQLNKSHIELFPIIVPPIELQNQYIQFLSQINKLKADVQKSIDKAQLLMDSLMQEYFG
ncbi:MAG: restriction endonuclease subunit S [Veillonella sp.]|nr:restriction endonuclease subunit S [Veillonella sp.]